MHNLTHFNCKENQGKNVQENSSEMNEVTFKRFRNKLNKRKKLQRKSTEKAKGNLKLFGNL